MREAVGCMICSNKQVKRENAFFVGCITNLLGILKNHLINSVSVS